MWDAVRNIVVGWLAPDAPLEVVERRQAICAACPLNPARPRLGWCVQCRCYIPAKVKVAAEYCPFGYW